MAAALIVHSGIDWGIAARAGKLYRDEKPTERGVSQGSIYCYGPTVDDATICVFVYRTKAGAIVVRPA